MRFRMGILLISGLMCKLMKLVLDRGIKIYPPADINLYCAE